MHEIEAWVEQAARNHGIWLVKLATKDAQILEERVRAHYVTGNPRVWWLSLSKPIQHFDSRATDLLDVIPNTHGRCWFIPQTSPTNLPVYDVEICQIETLLKDCPLFEYNLVAKDFSWLVIETDHNDFYVCCDRLLGSEGTR